MTKRYLLVRVGAIALLAIACAGTPHTEKPQYSPWHYSFSVPLDPEMPGTSPQLDLTMSLLRMEYPADQADFFSEVMYSSLSLDDYKDQVIHEQRINYRGSVSHATDNNWRRSETINIKRTLHRGIVVERDIGCQFGDGQDFQTKWYYVLDMEERKQLKIDDFFANYQGQPRLRDIIYEEMRKFSEVERGHPLSSGIFFSNEPELSFNFFITDDGLGLHWDSGQIAPDPVEIIVPWYAVRPMMLHSGMELLTKFNIYLFM